MTKEAQGNGGKEASSKSCLGKGHFSSDRKDNNAHVGRKKKEEHW